jgi:hydroxylamine dehydrogenase
MRSGLALVFLLAAVLCLSAPLCAEVSLSQETQACIECHQQIHPGIVADWQTSRMAKTTPGEGMNRPASERRISATTLPKELLDVVVGCNECHSQNQAQHKDNFEHAGFQINVVVSPSDCKVCHPVEADQYGLGKKAHARGNLTDNPVYSVLVNTIVGMRDYEGVKKVAEKPTPLTLNCTCFACHGTDVTVKGLRKVESPFGDFEVPDLSGWPNQGVGRLNPDGSRGACTVCHTRHAFSIAMARKPHTCGQCHLEPDVPTFNVYQESKHGNIFSSSHQGYDMEKVPWTPGKDFRSPTCASCHNSLLAAPDGGTTIAERTHDFGSRPWVRLFGLIYSHPQPKEGRTYIIKNKDGLTLPTAFTGEPASAFLIDAKEQEKRTTGMKRICGSCHGSAVVNGHFAKLDNSVKEADAMVKRSTLLLMGAWNDKLADKTNPFDEGIEQKWTSQWLFYANSLRFAGAMMGYDHAAFHYGWWNLSTNLQDLAEAIRLKKAVKHR